MIIVKRVKTEEDYQTCLMIRRKVFVEGQKVPEREEIDAFEKTSIHFLAFYENEPAATGRLRVEKTFVKFERIATLEMFRGRGIASKLMQEMQRVAQKDYPIYQMMMHAQTEAIPFYLKLGWRPNGERFYEAGIEHQKMIFSKGKD
ncbi:MAG: GNAT family N-acetyltransferase [Simkaniaceae bacterium]|nr:MAG: GNAT family N-acetyltransferase [Simkaniaceae bacterium]